MYHMSGARKAMLFLLQIGYSIITFGPLLWVFMLSLKSTVEIRESPYSLPAAPRWGVFRDVWVNSEYQTYFVNSTIVVCFAIVILIVVASMAAYAFAKLPFKGSEILFNLIFATIMIPGQILLIPLFRMLVHYKMVNSLSGLALVYVAVQMPMAVYILRSFFAQIPREMLEAARIDGCSEWGIFWRVMFPIAIPAVSSIMVINFVQLWNEFLFAAILIQQEDKKTLPLGVMKFVGDVYEDIGRMAAGMLIAIVPVIIIYIFFSEKFIKGMTQGSVKG